MTPSWRGRGGPRLVFLFVVVLGLFAALAGGSSFTATPSAWTTRPHHPPASTRERILHDDGTTFYHALHAMPKLDERLRPHFTRGSRADPQAQHELLIAVKQNNLDELDVMLQERSHPESGKYRQWLTLDEVSSFTANPTAHSAIDSWLSQQGITNIRKSRRGEFIKVIASVETWNRVLKADFHEFVDSHPKSSIVIKKRQLQRTIELEKLRKEKLRAPKKRVLASRGSKEKSAKSTNAKNQQQQQKYEEMDLDLEEKAGPLEPATILRSAKVFLPEHLMEHIVGIHQTTQVPPILSLIPRAHSGRHLGKDGNGEGDDADAIDLDALRSGWGEELGSAVASNMLQHARFVNGDTETRNLLHTSIGETIRADTKRRHTEMRTKMRERASAVEAMEIIAPPSNIVLPAPKVVKSSASPQTAPSSSSRSSSVAVSRGQSRSKLGEDVRALLTDTDLDYGDEDAAMIHEALESADGGMSELDALHRVLNSCSTCPKLIKFYQNKCTAPGPSPFGSYCMNPLLLKFMYNITAGGVASSPTGRKPTQEFFATNGQYYSVNDQYLFNTRWNSSAKTNLVSTPNGYQLSTSCMDVVLCGEGNLGMEYMMAIGKGAPTQYLEIDGGVYDHFLAWAYSAANSIVPNDVHSLSYGSYEINVDAIILYTFNVEALKLSLAGITIVAGSGDDGAPGSMFVGGKDHCLCAEDSSSNAYDKMTGWATTQTWPGMGGYFPIFPASCPYVTAVGGLASMSTDYRWCGYVTPSPTPSPTASYVKGPSRAPTGAPTMRDYAFCDPAYSKGKLVGLTLMDAYRRVEFMADTFTGNSKITSGGGFSAYWDRPWYQNVSVFNYVGDNNLARNAIPIGFNAQGRGYPDVSFQAVNYELIIGSQATLVDGTSAATPAFAGMITLINGYMLAHGLPTLGFINPTLYHSNLANLFVDIDNSYSDGPVNHCCGATPENIVTCCYESTGQGRPIGFPTVAGWDAATGLGSISMSRLIYAFNNLLPNSTMPGTFPPSSAPTPRPSGPTRVPTKTPTANPTNTAQPAWIAVTQTLSGAVIGSFVAADQVDLNTLAVRRVYSAVTNLKLENIYVESASDGTTTFPVPFKALDTEQSRQAKNGKISANNDDFRRLDTASEESPFILPENRVTLFADGRSLASNSFYITTVVFANLSGLSTTTLVQVVENSITNGVFTRTLQQIAANSGALGIANATAVGVPTSSYRVPTFAPTIDPALLDGTLVITIGVIIVSIAFTSVALLICYREGHLDRILGIKGYHRHNVCGMESDVADDHALGGRRYLEQSYDFAGVHARAAEMIGMDDSGGSGSSMSSSGFGSLYDPAPNSYARYASKAAGWKVKGETQGITLATATIAAQVPPDFLCPLSKDLMMDPYIAADGCTYDKEAIDAYLKSGKTASPTTGQPLTHTHLWPNSALKVQIDRFVTSKVHYKHEKEVEGVADPKEVELGLEKAAYLA